LNFLGHISPNGENCDYALSFRRETKLKRRSRKYLEIIITLIIKTSSDSEYLVNTVAKIHILSL
jgi:hypothetical protein